MSNKIFMYLVRYEMLAMTLSYLLASLPFLPFYILLLIILKVYKTIIFTILRIRYGRRLISLKGSDANIGARETEENSIFVIVTLNSKLTEEEIILKFTRKLEEKILKNCNEYKRLLSSPSKYAGYSFLLTEKVEADNFVSLLDVGNTEYKSINDIIYDYYDKPLPLNKLLWEVIVIKASQEWKMRNNIKENQIPVVSRFSHVIGDGLSIINLTNVLFGIEKDPLQKFAECFNSSYNEKNWLFEAWQVIYMFLIVPGFMLINTVRTLKNNTLWDNPKCSGSRHSVFKVENERKMVDKIKAIKKDISVDCRFSEIIMTAISDSIYQYFSEKCIPIPDSMGILLVVLKGLDYFSANGLPQITNNFSFMKIEMPIDVKSTSLLTRLEMVKRCMRKPEAHFGYEVSSFIWFHLCGLIPIPLQKYVVPLRFSTGVVSNIPFIPKISFCSGISIENLVFFTLQRDELGMGFGLMTYDNRIHLGFRAFEELIPLQEDCQMIADNFFTSIEKMEAELSNKEP